jgi:hypothetical protein
MSGSNAIAAAKRRRGGVNEINKNTQSQPSQNQSQPSQIHPLQLVMINHERLNKMSSDFSQFPQALDSLGENFNALSSNCDFLHNKLETLEKSVSGLLNGTIAGNNTLNSKSTDSSSLDLSNKLNLLEVRVNDLFKQFSTLQNFMLEISLTVNGVKERLNKNDSLHSYQLPSHVSPLSVNSVSVNVNEFNEVNKEQNNNDIDSSNLLSQEDLQNIKL